MPNYKWVVFPFLFEKRKKTISPNLLSFFSFKFSNSFNPLSLAQISLLTFFLLFFFSLFGVVSKLKWILVYVLLYLCPLMGYKYLRNCLRLVTCPNNEWGNFPSPKNCVRNKLLFSSKPKQYRGVTWETSLSKLILQLQCSHHTLPNVYHIYTICCLFSTK